MPALAAVVATSLDLILDCYGLASGYWEWNTDGAYARQIVGRNGRRGIPLSNFVGWLAIIAATVIASQAAVGWIPARRRRAWLPPLLLSVYYLPSAVWAVRARCPRYLVYSALAPLSIVLRLATLVGARRGYAVNVGHDAALGFLGDSAFLILIVFFAIAGVIVFRGLDH